MPKHQSYARIAITLPRERLAEADQLARHQDRPRSWIIAEAIRQYASSAANESKAREHSSSFGALNAGLGVQRRAQLSADLCLTVEERVRAAEDTARVAELRDRAGIQRVLAFNRYEDYLVWKKNDAGGR